MKGIVGIIEAEKFINRFKEGKSQVCLVCKGEFVVVSIDKIVTGQCDKCGFGVIAFKRTDITS